MLYPPHHTRIHLFLPSSVFGGIWIAVWMNRDSSTSVSACPNVEVWVIPSLLDLSSSLKCVCVCFRINYGWLIAWNWAYQSRLMRFSTPFPSILNILNVLYCSSKLRIAVPIDVPFKTQLHYFGKNSHTQSIDGSLHYSLTAHLGLMIGRNHCQRNLQSSFLPLLKSWASEVNWTGRRTM